MKFIRRTGRPAPSSNRCTSTCTWTISTRRTGWRSSSGASAPGPDEAGNPDGDELLAVYALPAGHPFCFGVH